MNTIFIGIAGGTGSGKTTLTEHLVSRFGDDIAVVHHDNYYKRQDCSFEERCKQNYDHPDAFDTDLMIRDLKKLKAGETIYCPVYDYAIHNRTDETVEIKPAKVVIVEGILIFQSKELRDLLDIKIFVETDADVRILRRALRDVEERGRSMQSVVTQYLTTVKPMHEQFVEPTRKYADIVVLEGGHNLVAPVPRLLGPGGCGRNRAGHPHRGGIKTAAALLAGRSENWQSAKRETGRSPSPFLPFVIQCTSFPPSPRRSSARHPWTGPGCVFCPPPGRR